MSAVALANLIAKPDVIGLCPKSHPIYRYLVAKIFVGDKIFILRSRCSHDSAFSGRAIEQNEGSRSFQNFSGF
jgi:hypothetical protein